MRTKVREKPPFLPHHSMKIKGERESNFVKTQTSGKLTAFLTF
jgi:hypothetical protein